MLYLALKSEYHLSLQASERSNNFAFTMSNENAEYANEIFRSRYHLGFIDAVEPLKELDLERHLVIRLHLLSWSWGTDLALSATNILCHLTTKNIMSICYSSTEGYVLWSLLN